MDLSDSGVAFRVSGCKVQGLGFRIEGFGASKTRGLIVLFLRAVTLLRGDRSTSLEVCTKEAASDMDLLDCH